MLVAALLVAVLVAGPGTTLSRPNTSAPPASRVQIREATTGRVAGLEFRRPRRPPPPPVPRVVLGAKTTDRLVALTFDLDMTPGMAAQVKTGASWFNARAVAYLRSQHVHATLFITGMWAEVYPAIARQLAQDPDFEIGNHSYSHPAFHAPCYRLGLVGRAAQAEQIRMGQQAIAWATGVTPKYFRFPGGCYDRTALDLVHAAGLIPIEWNVNSIDAFNWHPEQIRATVLGQVKPGSIVVMHLQGGLNAPSTGEALRQIVPALESRGYRFVTISELLAAGSPIQPGDPREVVEAYQPPPPYAVRPAVRPTPRWCGWQSSPKGWIWVCR